MAPNLPVLCRIFFKISLQGFLVLVQLTFLHKLRRLAIAEWLIRLSTLPILIRNWNVSTKPPLIELHMTNLAKQMERGAQSSPVKLMMYDEKTLNVLFYEFLFDYGVKKYPPSEWQMFCIMLNIEKIDFRSLIKRYFFKPRR